MSDKQPYGANTLAIPFRLIRTPASRPTPPPQPPPPQPEQPTGER